MRDDDSTGCRVRLTYLTHLKRVYVRGVHGRGVNRSFLVINVAAFLS